MCEPETAGAYAVQHGNETLYLVESYKGMVIKLTERNGSWDSDFYATVWDDETQSAHEIEYATTRAWTYCNSATVDASPEIIAKYNAWKQAKNDEITARLETAKAAVPEKGKELIVVAGRKHKGKKGRCFWRGYNQFRQYYANGYNKRSDFENQRVGIETDDGDKFFTALLQCRVVGYEDANLTQCEAIINTSNMLYYY